MWHVFHALFRHLLPLRLRSMDIEADDLADKISSLSMMDAKVSSSGKTSNSLIRTVTLPASEENESYKYDFPARLSIENDEVNANLSRPSFDGHSCELTRHLYGNSPHGRPPKVASVACEVAHNNSGNRSSRTPCGNNLCFVTTYVFHCVKTLQFPIILMFAVASFFR